METKLLGFVQGLCKDGLPFGGPRNSDSICWATLRRTLVLEIPM